MELKPIDDWIISSATGEFHFQGSEREAERVRAHRDKWREPTTKRRALPKEVAFGVLIDAVRDHMVHADKCPKAEENEEFCGDSLCSYCRLRQVYFDLETR